MARARNIKPGFFKNEDLAELPFEVRLLFIGLWTLADREGRLEDRPKRIKGELFPFESFDVDSMLNQLQAGNFVARYEVGGSRFLEVVNFVKHQDPHYKEKASEIPAPPGRSNLIEATGVTRETRARIMGRDGYVCRCCGATEYLSIDHIVPASRGGGGDDSNLQVLCLSCNLKKGNKMPGEEKGIRRSKHVDTSIRVRPDVESTTGQAQPDVDSTLNQVRPDVPGSIPLIPSSLIPDSGEKKRARKRATPPPTRPPDVAERVWSDWLRLRDAKRAPVTETVVAEAVREAGKAGMTLEAFLSVWCSRGSQGLQADWLKPNERHGSALSFQDRSDAVFGAAL